MPIKLPKGFPRRKSSGNALEDNPSPQQTSFRVFERVPNSSKSFEGATALSHVTGKRPASDGCSGLENAEHSALNRGSGGTQNSSLTGGLDDTSSSVRLGSSSTLPSLPSLDVGREENLSTRVQHVKKSTNSAGFSLKAAGRTFSFGGRKSGSPSMQPPDAMPLPQQHLHYSDIPEVQSTLRQRAMTETSYTSVSTAIPPRLLETNFGDEDGNGFSDIFAEVDTDRRKASLSVREHFTREVDKTYQHSTHVAARPESSTFVPPLQTSRARSSSRERLISIVPKHNTHTHGTKNREFVDVNGMHSESPSGMTPINVKEENNREPKSLSSVAKRMSESGPSVWNDDTRLAMRYMDTTGRESRPLPDCQERKAILSQHSYNDPSQLQPRGITLYDGKNQDHQDSDLSPSGSLATTPRSRQISLPQQGESLMNDVDFQQMAISAENYQLRSESPPSRLNPLPVSRGKIMTPAQFERYKKEQESMRNKYALETDSESEDDKEDETYEDDDEEEISKELARQRRRQDAQLSVYRQQMMKVTGEQQPLNSINHRSGQSISNFSTSGMGPQEKLVDNRSSEEDEDEDIPLGILAAHGFPSKDRPPSQINRITSQPNIRYTSETYPAPPPLPVHSSAASTRDGTSTSIPAFARNLPKDPFFGAGLVNSNDRHSLAFGLGSQSVHGGSQAGSQNPGGLVGVIAKEERARAMRRGSPNAATFDLPGGNVQSSSLGIPQNGLNSEQQAQMQMSQQMTQMMQMQMQWMQQMMAMQGLSGQQIPPMPPFPNMPMAGESGQHHNLNVPTSQLSFNAPSYAQRPTSMEDSSVTNNNQHPQLGARSMSMLSPDPQQWGAHNPRSSYAPSQVDTPGRSSTFGTPTAYGMDHSLKQHAGYAVSLAPSERSNIGLASRYRPVSTAVGVDAGGRTSTMGSAALRPWEGYGKGKAAVTGRTVPSTKKHDDDDDDDEGWEQMRQKREKKRSLWRGRKTDRSEENSSLDGVFYPTKWAEATS